MFIYSQTILQFAEELKAMIRMVLAREVGLKCTAHRFFDKKGQYSYPIRVAIYNDRSMLGYFDPSFYELGFHEQLRNCCKEQLLNIVRHEVAHYLTFIQYGPAVRPHVQEFRQFCRERGWGEEVYLASMELKSDFSLPEESSVLRKVKKLMALGSSSHPHEAEQAILKSQQLLFKHQLDEAKVHEQMEPKVFMQRILKQKKESAKMRAIGSILQTFFVGTVYHRSADGWICLEIFGEALNLEIANYVAQVLDKELDRLWTGAQKTSGLKGMVAKNSFLTGIAKGYCQKVKAFKESHESTFSRTLVNAMETKLEEAKNLIYSRLVSKSSSAKHCPHSSRLGEKMGRELNIRPAVGKTNDTALQLS